MHPNLKEISDSTKPKANTNYAITCLTRGSKVCSILRVLISKQSKFVVPTAAIFYTTAVLVARVTPSYKSLSFHLHNLPVHSQSTRQSDG